MIASPEVRLRGPRADYQEIADVLDEQPADTRCIGLKDITVIDDKHTLFHAMRSAMSAAAGTPGFRLGRAVLSGQVIDDAYIYRAGQRSAYRGKRAA